MPFTVQIGPPQISLHLWRLSSTMTKISYVGCRFPPMIVQQAIWLYVRFTLSFRDVEDLLALSPMSRCAAGLFSDPRSLPIFANAGRSRIRPGIWTKSI
jgi:hypothetical protein